MILESLAPESAKSPPVHILNCDQPDTEDCVAFENNDEDAVAMIEESPPNIDRDGRHNYLCKILFDLISEMKLFSSLYLDGHLSESMD